MISSHYWDSYYTGHGVCLTSYTTMNLNAWAQGRRERIAGYPPLPRPDWKRGTSAEKVCPWCPAWVPVDVADAAMIGGHRS
jgi:hypothetical protein